MVDDVIGRPVPGRLGRVGAAPAAGRDQRARPARGLRWAAGHASRTVNSNLLIPEDVFLLDAGESAWAQRALDISAATAVVK